MAPSPKSKTRTLSSSPMAPPVPDLVLARPPASLVLVHPTAPMLLVTVLVLTHLQPPRSLMMRPRSSTRSRVSASTPSPSSTSTSNNLTTIALNIPPSTSPMAMPTLAPVLTGNPRVLAKTAKTVHTVPCMDVLSTPLRLTSRFAVALPQRTPAMPLPMVPTVPINLVHPCTVAM